MDAFVFDIDGTLIDSDQADAKLFVEAAKRVLGVTEVRTDWTTYEHVTDQGVLLEIMSDYGIPPERTLVDATRKEFIYLLSSHVAEHGPFPEIPGAVEFISKLATGEGCYVAYATGAWLESAMIKLTSAGFPTEGIPISTSSEFEDRVSIMKGAVSAAPRKIKSITYYGDGVWDQTASRELGWDFVPVGKALGGIEDFHGTAT